MRFIPTIIAATIVAAKSGNLRGMPVAPVQVESAESSSSLFTRIEGEVPSSGSFNADTCPLQRLYDGFNQGNVLEQNFSKIFQDLVKGFTTEGNVVTEGDVKYTPMHWTQNNQSHALLSTRPDGTQHLFMQSHQKPYPVVMVTHDSEIGLKVTKVSSSHPGTKNSLDFAKDIFTSYGGRLQLQYMGHVGSAFDEGSSIQGEAFIPFGEKENLLFKSSDRAGTYRHGVDFWENEYDKYKASVRDLSNEDKARLKEIEHKSALSLMSLVELDDDNNIIWLDPDTGMLTVIDTKSDVKVETPVHEALATDSEIEHSGRLAGYIESGYVSGSGELNSRRERIRTEPERWRQISLGKHLGWNYFQTPYFRSIVVNLPETGLGFSPIKREAASLFEL